MNNNLGRDKIWSDPVWQEIDKAVMAEVGRIRVAQKVFPGSLTPNASNVSADIFDPETMTIAEGQTKPFIEISIEFSLTQSQVDNEATLRTGRTLARLSAKSIAFGEDVLFLQGADGPLPSGVNVVNRQAADDGLLGASAAAINVDPPDTAKQGVYGEATFKAVVRGIAELTKNTQPGPYALLLESSIYADTYAPLPSTLITTADRIIPLVTGGFYGTGALPSKTGLLVSLGGEPTTVYVGADAITGYTQEDRNGNHLFRVFERVQLVARDKRALVRLDFR